MPNARSVAPALVSVVVPVYNAAATVRTTIQAIRGQSWPDLEIVVIDDGSTDGSSQILDGLASEDPRVRVVHQPNSGVWAARLAGIAEARGAWLAWCDADDVPHPDMIADLMACADANDAELAVCAYRRVDVDGTLLSVESSADLGPRLDPADDPVGFATINTALWNKVFRMDVVRESVAVNGTGLVPPRICEDLVLYASFLDGIRTVGVVAEPRYDYVVRPDSLMTTLDTRDAEIVATWLSAIRARLDTDRAAVVDSLAFMHLGVAPLNVLAAQPAATSRAYDAWARRTLRRDFPLFTTRARALRGAALRTVVARALFRLGILDDVLRLLARRG